MFVNAWLKSILFEIFPIKHFGQHVQLVNVLYE